MSFENIDSKDSESTFEEITVAENFERGRLHKKAQDFIEQQFETSRRLSNGDEALYHESLGHKLEEVWEDWVRIAKKKWRTWI